MIDRSVAERGEGRAGATDEFGDVAREKLSRHSPSCTRFTFAGSVVSPRASRFTRMRALLLTL